MANAILLIWCPDTKGIVAGVADFIYKNGGNIVHSDQHTDTAAKCFYMRIEWELGGFAVPREKLAETIDKELARPFKMQWRLCFSDERRRTALLVSKFDHCLWDLLLRHRAGELPMDVPLVVSNHPDLEEVARFFAIPYHHIPVGKEEKDKEAAEAKQLALLKENEVDLIVLARYMQVLSPEFVAAYPNRIINVHHSFLPAFQGARPYHQAYERGVKVVGATSHYVTEDLDEGPIIDQTVAPTSHRDSVEDLIRKGRDLEKISLARAVRLELQNRVLRVDNKTVVFG